MGGNRQCHTNPRGEEMAVGRWKSIPLISLTHMHKTSRGGFVAVSYEAKARGVRKGDGIGERGQKELAWFKDRPDAVMSAVGGWFCG